MMWQKVDNQLYKKFVFKDFAEAFGFLQRVAVEAERLNHHPKISNKWNEVELWLNSHETDAITEKDHQLAAAIDIVHKPSNMPLALDDGKLTTELPELKEIKLYADGGSRGNPGHSASGYVLMDMNDNIILKSGVYLGITTNNQAEYQALKFGLEQASKLGAREVHAYMDSLLVVNQMKGIFKVRNRDLWPIYEAIKELAASFKKVTYQHIPRALNTLADAEVNTTLDAELQK
jgi:ribonuclease HI/pterin-4a-carbinolamine dehydratase